MLDKQTISDLVNSVVELQNQALADDVQDLFRKVWGLARECGMLAGNDNQLLVLDYVSNSDNRKYAVASDGTVLSTSGGFSFDTRVEIDLDIGSCLLYEFRYRLLMRQCKLADEIEVRRELAWKLRELFDTIGR